MRAQADNELFVLFFDVLVPCVAGKKVWTEKAKIKSTISNSGKVSITDEAFTELCILNYWNKWQNRGPAKWTDSRAGNIFHMGWQPEAYTAFDAICRRIKQQRETDRRLGDASKEQEFLDYATKMYGPGSALQNRKRCRLDDDGPDLFNELDEDGVI